MYVCFCELDDYFMLHHDIEVVTGFTKQMA